MSESARSVFARRALEGSRNAASTTSVGAMQVDIWVISERIRASRISCAPAIPKTLYAPISKAMGTSLSTWGFSESARAASKRGSGTSVKPALGQEISASRGRSPVPTLKTKASPSWRVRSKRCLSWVKARSRHKEGEVRISFKMAACASFSLESLHSICAR